MQRVTSMLPSWDKTKTNSKKGFDTAWKALDKLGGPVNKLSNKIGSEAFWPTSLDKESDKAARILKSFCKDGFYAEEDRPLNQEGAKGKQRVLKKIPQKVIENAVGLAIFTTMRSGLWVSGAGGSGVLVARMEDGNWSPPSGILLHTAGLGFLVGIDIYDCVVVINNRRALDSFTKVRATIGGEISAVAGPAGVGGIIENDGKWNQANRPVFTYLKSRGFYAGVQVDGTVIIERTDENERFYGERIGVADILAGKARHPPYEIKMLMETLKAAEGSNDVDVSALQALSYEPAPGDFEIQTPSPEAPTFGIPEPDDPDPFGVLALEREGFEIREAGTKARPPSTQFEFNPSPTSPVYQKYHRQSMDTISSLNNRASYMSNRSFRTNRTSTGRLTPTVEMGTQTDDHITPITSPSQSDEQKRIIEEEIDYTKVDLGPYSSQGHNQDHDSTTATDASREHDRNDHRAADSSYATETEDDEPVVFEAASAQTAVLMPQSIAKGGGLVNIPKRPPPPPLPPRNLARASKVLTVDQSSGQSPMKSDFGASQTSVVSDFEEVDLHGGNRKSEELVKGIVLDDLEKSEPRRSVDEEVDRALEEQHLEKLEKIESSEPETEKFEDAAQEADPKTEAETETETENEHENELETPGTQHDDVMWTASPYEEKQAPQVTPAVHEEEPAMHEEEPAMHEEEPVMHKEELVVEDDDEPTVHDEESKMHEKKPSVHEEKALVHEE